MDSPTQWNPHHAFCQLQNAQGVLNHAQKEEIIHRTTALFVEYFGEGVRPFSMVLIDEVADGGWGRTDEVLTMEKMGIGSAAHEASD